MGFSSIAFGPILGRLPTVGCWGEVAESCRKPRPPKRRLLANIVKPAGGCSF